MIGATSGGGLANQVRQRHPPSATVYVNSVRQPQCEPRCEPPPSTATSTTGWVFPSKRPLPADVCADGCADGCADVCDDVSGSLCSMTTSSRCTGESSWLSGGSDTATCSDTSSEWTSPSASSLMSLFSEPCSFSSSSAGSSITELMHEMTDAVHCEGGSGQTALKLYSEHLAEIRCVDQQEKAVEVVHRLLRNFTCTVQDMFETTLLTTGISERRRVTELKQYSDAAQQHRDTVCKLQEKIENQTLQVDELVGVEIKVCIPKWYRRLLIYRECGGEDPLPPWIGTSCIDIPPQYMSLYCQWYGPP